MSYTGTGEVTVVHVRSVVDLVTARDLAHVVRERLEAGCRRLVVDLGEGAWLDGSGLRVLVEATVLLHNREGSLAVATRDIRVRRVLELSGLDRILPVFESVDEALQ